MNCTECQSVFPTFKATLLHLKIVHKYNNLSTYKCRVQNCTRNFNNLHSYRTHFAKSHKRHTMQNIKSKNCPTPFDQTVNAFATVAQDNVPIDVENDVADIPQQFSFTLFKKLLREQVLIFLAKLYDSSLIPRSFVQTIIDNISELLGSGGFIDSLKVFILENLQNITDEVKNEIEKIFGLLQNPFDGFKTEYSRMQQFEKHNHLIQPIPYVVGEVMNDVRKNNVIRYQAVEATGHFVPLRQQFQKFFEHSNFFEVIHKYVNSLETETDTISNVMQSQLWKTIKKKISTDQCVLPLYLYYDEFETGNALGSHAGLHKLGAVYITLPCIPAEYLSKLSNIFLALLFHSDDRKLFGNKPIFKILIDELVFLETKGILIKTKNGDKIVYFALTNVLGDNLGLNGILGFVECFTSNFFCRMCTMSRAECQQSCGENKEKLRTRQNYESGLQLQNFSQTGIKEECIFHSLKSFNVTANPSVDIMHDLLEGICHYDVILILKHFILDQKLISLECLNFRLKTFPFSNMDLGNRPPQIPFDFHRKSKLSFSASEMLCFIRIFNFIVGEDIPIDNEFWKLYSNLRNILEICMASAISDHDINILEFLIKEHNNSYKTLSGENLKPKFHFLVHYPGIMRQIGPLINIWSMRFESKHKESKMNANVICNRRNITRSLSFKHQLKVCFRLLSSECFQSITAHGKTGFVHSLNEFLNVTGPLHEFLFKTQWYSCKWVFCNGIKYTIHSTLLIDSINLLPQFGILNCILVNDSLDICLVLNLPHTVTYNDHLHAYEINDTGIVSTLLFNDIMCTKLCNRYTFASGKTFISFMR